MSQITFDLNAETAGKLNSFIQTFGSEELLFEKFIEFYRNRLKREIARMQIDLNDFEKKYNMTSVDFFEKFESGTLGDERDFMVWSGIFEMQQDSKNKLAKLS